MPVIARLRFLITQTGRKLFSMLPQKRRHEVYRSFVDCKIPNERLVLKIAESREELEACFKLLHDAYVSSGFMTPDPSGMRVTIYHALPTTTTLCAKIGDQVVGTLSLIRESAIGFPLQRIFDLTEVREQGRTDRRGLGPRRASRYRRTGGTILFPLMKFMYEYCTTFFDTRHLVIAVNPRHIEMYESLLFFRRLTANVVENYDFVNGAPPSARRWTSSTRRKSCARPMPASRPAAQPAPLFLRNQAAQHPDTAPALLHDQRPGDDPDLIDYFFNQNAPPSSPTSASARRRCCT
jgi:hypothetical protein